MSPQAAERRDLERWLDALPDGACVVDRDGTLLAANRAWLRAFPAAALGPHLEAALADGWNGGLTVRIDGVPARLHLSPVGVDRWLVVHRAREPRNPASGLLAAVREGVDADEFGVHLQSIVDVDLGRTVGAEALLRWQRAGIGLLLAEDFLEAAIVAGQGHSLEWIAITKAVEQAAALQASAREVKVFVNISPRLLVERGTAARVLEVVERAGADPAGIVVELTEESLDDEFPRVATALHPLHDAGLGLAVDDFGVGFSALRRVGELPLDYLKLDSGLTLDVDTNRRAQQVVAGVRALADRLDIDVIAEGVERPAQADALRSLGIRLQQGFHHAPAVPPAELAGTTLV